MSYDLTTSQLVIIIILVIWEIAWKGVALWRAARRNEPYWFVALLVINTAGIFPILYILFTEQRDVPLDDQSRSRQ